MLTLPSTLFLPIYHSTLQRKLTVKMDRRRRKQPIPGPHDDTNSCCSEEVSSIEWEFIKLSEEEEDLVYRMHRLVGDRWELIAGRIPGRKAEEIERFWVMRHHHGFAGKRADY